MQAVINLLLVLMFIPVVGSAVVLFIRLRETPKGNRALDSLLEEMSSLEKKRKDKDESEQEDAEPDSVTDTIPEEKKNEESPAENSSQLSDEELAVIKAKENAAALFQSTDKAYTSPDPEKLRKEAAAEKVMQMMAMSRKTGLTDTDIRKMVNELSDKK